MRKTTKQSPVGRENEWRVMSIDWHTVFKQNMTPWEAVRPSMMIPKPVKQIGTCYSCGEFGQLRSACNKKKSDKYPYLYNSSQNPPACNEAGLVLVDTDNALVCTGVKSVNEPLSSVDVSLDKITDYVSLSEMEQSNVVVDTIKRVWEVEVGLV